MAKLHWHLNIGNPGCMPDSNEPYRTKADALDRAQEYIREERQQGARVLGSRRIGFWQVQRGPHSFLNYDVAPCREDACAAELAEM